ncbi:hypothetical protein AMTR_s00048p00133860, partial [Amborella trichopoda]
GKVMVTLIVWARTQKESQGYTFHVIFKISVRPLACEVCPRKQVWTVVHPPPQPMGIVKLNLTASSGQPWTCRDWESFLIVRAKYTCRFWGRCHGEVNEAEARALLIGLRRIDSRWKELI